MIMVTRSAPKNRRIYSFKINLSCFNLILLPRKDAYSGNKMFA